MKFVRHVAAVLSFLCCGVPVLADQGPASTSGPMWAYVVNNAQRTADKYATAREPRAVFVGPSVRADFVHQIAGEYQGRYVLQLLHDRGGNVSLARLLPLFDEFAPSDSLDDEAQLWRVIDAKFNGRPF